MIKVYKIKVGEKVYEVEVEAVTEKEGRIQETSKAVEKTAAPTGEGVKVEAPMQGKILDVCVSVGAKVKEGDTLVIIEAMKMENPIVSPCDGTVTAVAVNKGDMVDGGDLVATVAK